MGLDPKRGGWGVMSVDPSPETPDDGALGREQISITLPDPMIEVIDEELKGTIGTSRSDAIKTALAIYLTENGLMELGEAIVRD